MALFNFLRVFLLIALMVFSLTVSANGRHERQPEPFGPLHAGDLQVDRPQEIIRTEGGSIHGWRSHILRCAQVAMHETTLEENGLAIPKYMDVPSVTYVVEGCGIVGIAYPHKGEFRQKYYVRRVTAGDVIAVPQGVVFWLYNNGKEQQRVMCVSETSKATKPGVSSKPFFLSGAKKRDVGGLLHGFSEDTLAEALGVNQSTVRKLRTSQKEVAITKTRRKIHLPFPEHTQHYENDVAGEFTFTLRGSKADLIVENGGWLSMVTRNKLPVLAHVGMSAVRVNLEPDAMMAPMWSSNAHQIFRALRGNGRIEVSSNAGDKLLHTDLKENEVVVVPKFCPSTIVADEDGLELITIMTSDSPAMSYFAGANSVYKGIPPQVVAEAFGIDLEEELDIRGRRTRQEVILPPPEEDTREYHGRNGGDDCQQQSFEEESEDDPSLVKAVLSWAQERLKEELAALHLSSMPIEPMY